ncbi:hypothetical protein ACIRON_02955 [Nocardioides sp. NPDC101246]|uniref:hypothetical protein n=1 Tax=Nocardioides sp. NPDC101246 TaxID=3364336 RepID=UPI003800AC2A
MTIDPLGSDVDRLGPANAEQRAERKEQRRAERRASLRRVGLTVLIDGIFGLGLVVGAVVGALNHDAILGWIR